MKRKKWFLLFGLLLLATAYAGELRYVIATSINLREQPNTSAKIVAILPIDTQVEIQQTNNPSIEWAEVVVTHGDHKDKRGWIAREFLASQAPTIHSLISKFDQTPKSDDDTRRMWAERAVALEPGNAEALNRMGNLGLSDIFHAEVDQYRKSVIGYGVYKAVMYVDKGKGESVTTKEEERCVFNPIFRHDAKAPDDYTNWSLKSDSTAKYPLSHLKKLNTYTILDNKGTATTVKYEHFEMVMNAYPNHFAGSPVPKEGCGALLLFSPFKVQTANAPENINKFISLLERDEHELFLSAVCSEHAKAVMHPTYDASLCKNERYSLEGKSKSYQFYDGQVWYLVRSYNSPRALIFYRIDLKNNKLVPIPGFISHGDGEQYLSLGYVVGVDIDGDGTNEVIVHQGGWEWSGFGYLKKYGDVWK